MTEYNTEAPFPFPETLVQNANWAQMLCEGAFCAHAEYHGMIANMMEQFDGKYPKDPALLIERGMEYLSNVPYRKGAAKLENVATSRMNLFRAAIIFSKICFKPWNKEYEDKPEYYFLANEDLARNFAMRLSRLFVEMLHRDPHFLTTFLLQLAQQQTSWGYGLSCRREHSIFSEVPQMLNVYFERADRPENIKVFIEVFYQRAADLYALWVKQEELGWVYYQKDGIEEALRWAIQQETGINYQSWAAILKAYEGADLINRLGRSPEVSWAWIWNEEIEGGVTRTMYLWNRGLVNSLPQGVGNMYGSDSVMPNGTFLSYQRHYPDMEVTDVFRVYPNSGMSNDRIVQNYRGLGIYAYEEDIWYNQIRNALNDAIAFNIQTVFQPEFGGQLTQFEISNFGPYALLAPGFPIVDRGNQSPALQQAVALLQYDDAQYENKLTSQYNPQVAGRIPDRANRDAVNSITTEVAQQQNEAATVPLDALQKELMAILKRMLETYKKGDPGYETWKYFKERVITAMFPVREWDMTKEGWKADRDEAQNKFFRALIESIDYVGLDYVTNDILSLDALFQMAPTPEGKEYYRGRLAWSRGATFSEIQSFFPSADDPAKNINDMPLALIENALFWDTHEIAYNTLQNPVTHLQAHLFKASEVTGSFKNGVDPVQIFKWLSNMLQNAKMHLDQLAQDPYQQQEFEQFKDLYEGNVELADQFGKIAQQMAQQMNRDAEAQAQQQPEMDPVAIAKIQMLQIQGEEKMRRTQEQSQFRQKLMAEGQAFRQQLERERFQQQQLQQAEAFRLKQNQQVSQ